MANEIDAEKQKKAQNSDMAKRVDAVLSDKGYKATDIKEYKETLSKIEQLQAAEKAETAAYGKALWEKADKQDAEAEAQKQANIEYGKQLWAQADAQQAAEARLDTRVAEQEVKEDAASQKVAAQADKYAGKLEAKIKKAELKTIIKGEKKKKKSPVFAKVGAIALMVATGLGLIGLTQKKPVAATDTTENKTTAAQVEETKTAAAATSATAAPAASAAVAETASEAKSTLTDAKSAGSFKAATAAKKAAAPAAAKATASATDDPSVIKEGNFAGFKYAGERELTQGGRIVDPKIKDQVGKDKDDHTTVRMFETKPIERTPFQPK